MGVKESIRLKVRDKEQDFFKEYILETNGTLKCEEVEKQGLNEAKENMLKAVAMHSWISLALPERRSTSIRTAMC